MILEMILRMIGNKFWRMILGWCRECLLGLVLGDDFRGDFGDDVGDDLGDDFVWIMEWFCDDFGNDLVVIWE